MELGLEWAATNDTLSPFLVSAMIAGSRLHMRDNNLLGSQINERPWRDVMLVCRSGHVVTDSLRANPEMNVAHCTQ